MRDEIEVSTYRTARCDAWRTNLYARYSSCSHAQTFSPHLQAQPYGVYTNRRGWQARSTSSLSAVVRRVNSQAITCSPTVRMIQCMTLSYYPMKQLKYFSLFNCSTPLPTLHSRSVIYVGNAPLPSDAMFIRTTEISKASYHLVLVDGDANGEQLPF